MGQTDGIGEAAPEQRSTALVNSWGRRPASWPPGWT